MHKSWAIVDCIADQTLIFTKIGQKVIQVSLKEICFHCIIININVVV